MTKHLQVNYLRHKREGCERREYGSLLQSRMLTSVRNEFFFKLRSRFRFSRRGYSEARDILAAEDEEDTILERKLLHDFFFSSYRARLSPLQWKRNLSTLWLLNSFKRWPDVLLHLDKPFLDVGCQDFSRLPALKHFFGRAFSERNTEKDAKKDAEKKIEIHANVQIHGLELDPYPILDDLHSRWDRAHYYISLMKNEGNPHDAYFAADFFTWPEKTSGLFCFFPFVTPGPALSWGLPKRFGDVQKWLEAIKSCLEKDGFAFIVHQGPDEQKVFDEARSMRAPFLKLIERHELSCPFWPPKKPSCASLYVRDSG